MKIKLSKDLRRFLRSQTKEKSREQQYLSAKDIRKLRTIKNLPGILELMLTNKSVYGRTNLSLGSTLSKSRLCIFLKRNLNISEVI